MIILSYVYRSLGIEGAAQNGSLQVPIIKLILEYAQRDSCLERCYIFDDFVFGILGYHFVAIREQIIPRVVWVIPHRYDL